MDLLCWPQYGRLSGGPHSYLPAGPAFAGRMPIRNRQLQVQLKLKSWLRKQGWLAGVSRVCALRIRRVEVGEEGGFQSEFPLVFSFRKCNSHAKWISKWMPQVNKKNRNEYLRSGLPRNAQLDNGRKHSGRGG